MQCTVVPQQEDPLFFDREGLEAVASGTVVAEGLRASGLSGAVAR